MVVPWCPMRVKGGFVRGFATGGGGRGRERLPDDAVLIGPDEPLFIFCGVETLTCYNKNDSI